MKLINKDEVLKQIKFRQWDIDEDDEYAQNHEISARIDECYIITKRVEEISEVDAIPVRHGKWVKISPANIFECSKCGKNVMTNDISEYNFCHGCGADMRGERREDDRN